MTQSFSPRKGFGARRGMAALLVCAVVLACGAVLPDGAWLPLGGGRAVAAPANGTFPAPVVPAPSVAAPAAPKAPKAPAVAGASAASPAQPAGAAAAGVPGVRNGQKAPGAGVPAVAAGGGPANPSLPDMIGQMLLVGFRGTQPQAAMSPAVGGLPGMAALLAQGMAEVREGAGGKAGKSGATGATGDSGASGATGVYGVAEVQADIRAGRVGGVILFDRDVATGSPQRNIVSPAQVRALSATLQAAASASPLGLPVFVSVDQEGGRVQRLKAERGFTQHPSPRELGKGEPDATRLRAAALGRELADVGVNLNFAPAVDVDVNPDSPAIGRLGRSYGRDPRRVAAHAAAFINGMAQAGVISCLKHFPGHGSARADSHLGVTDVSATRLPEELLPYRLLLRPQGNAWADGWAGMVMVGHLYDNRLDAAHPATLSRPTIDGLLRRTLGWRGVVVTDDLQMGAITDRYTLEETVFRAVDAGADILLFGNNLRWQPDLTARVHETLTRLVREGRITEDRIRQSYQRITRLKGLLAVPTADMSDTGAGGLSLPDLLRLTDEAGGLGEAGSMDDTGGVAP